MTTLQDEIDEKLPGTEDDSLGSEVTWKLVSVGAGVLAGIVARKLLSAVWARVGTGDGEVDPGDRRVGWIEAAQWAIASGIAVGVARTIGQRAAARAWERASGSPPPGQST